MLYRIRGVHAIEFNDLFDRWLETLDYDYTVEEYKERFSADRAEFIRANLDRTKWSSRIDEKLMETFLVFFNK